MLIFLALADGPSSFRATELSSHARTVIRLLETLTTARFSVSPLGAGVLVRVRPISPTATRADRS
jgi:RNA 3'-terminal phosphate cyclase